MPPTRAISRTLAADAWRDVLSRGWQMFAYYHWWKLEKQNPTFVTDSTCVTVRNAALESSLMSIRDLDDFFSRPTPRDDDLHSSDYGYPASPSFLTSAERESINKKLAHLTYQAARELASDPLRTNPRTWNNADMVDKAAKRLLNFLDHLEHQFFAGDAGQIGMIQTARKTMDATLNNITRVAHVEMDFTA